MNEIRKNNEEEKVLIEGKFKLSLGAFLVIIIGTLFLGTPLGLIIGFAPSMTGEVNGEPATGWSIALPFIFMIGSILLFFWIVQLLRIIAIKKCKLVVTNKRIYGKYSVLIATKNFSYRLDEIDNVEMVSTFGQNTLAVQFTQGHGPTQNFTTYVNGVPTSYGNNVLRMTNLRNYQEIMDVMNELITSRKNLVDVQIDIEMNKLDAENRKADALENVAKNIAVGASVANNQTPVETNSNKDDYINELRELKKLLDEGVITKKEFEREKKEILDNNHK